MLVLTYLHWCARILWPGRSDCDGALRVGPLRDADEELATGEEDVGSGEQGLGRRGLHHGLVELLS